MRKNLDVLVISPKNPLRSFSGIKYLCDSLCKLGLRLELYSIIPPYMLHEAKEWGYPVKTFMINLIRYIPKIPNLYYALRAFIEGLRGPNLIIYVDIHFVMQMAWVKKIRRNVKLIQYCPEFQTFEDFPHLHNKLKIYQKYANLPDLIIDVDPNRALLRQEYFGIKKKIEVIPNTLPLSSLPKKSPKGSLIKLARTDISPSLPILLYIGRASPDRCWEIIVNALKKVKNKVFFLAFCTGTTAEKKIVKKLFRKNLASSAYCIAEEVPREKLLKSIHEADAGLVYYRPSDSINKRFAAPTKLYEYIAMGVPIISSNNPSIVKILKEESIGIYVRDESSDALAEAIDVMFEDSMKRDIMAKNAKRVFTNKLCYEKVASKVIDCIQKLIK